MSIRKLWWKWIKHSVQLEYCVQFWKNVVAVEKVQSRFTKILPGLEHLSCEEKLIRLEFCFLRAEKAD